jgi:hypothetical protein
MNELERALLALGREVEVPETPDLVQAVRAELASARREAPIRRRWALAVALTLVALLGAMLAIPDARSAFLRIFDIGGERIELVDELPEIPLEDDLELTLGDPSTLDEARRVSGFPLHELDEAPDRVYLGDRGTVWFLYGDPARPRLLVSQTPRATLDPEALYKKVAGAGSSIELVDVDGAHGAFLSGDPHYFFLLDEHGDVIEDSARLARDVLVWSEGDVTYRLEGDFDRDEALRLADDLRQRG